MGIFMIWDILTFLFMKNASHHIMFSYFVIVMYIGVLYIALCAV